MGKDYGKYMEFNYDSASSTTSEIYAQYMEDMAEAHKYEEEEKELQKNKIEEFMSEDKTEEEKASEYLVDGAILECNRATLKPKTVEGMKCTPKDGRTIIRLQVGEKGRQATANGLKYANVNDARINDNIFPFPCNCENPPDRQTEIDAIVNDTECETLGNCRHLMKLNSRWYNLPSESGAEYLSFGDQDGKKQTGINMTSCLFCKHGGFITPINSGQIILMDEDELKVPDKGASAEEVFEYIKQFLLKQSLSKECVAGILGNIYVESIFDPTCNVLPNVWGLFQFDSNRKAMLEEWAKSHGFSDYSSVDAQCAYALYEFQTSNTKIYLKGDIDYPNGLFCNYESFYNSKDATEAALIFAAAFERCFISTEGDKKDVFIGLQGRNERVKAAEEYLKEIK